MWISSGQTTLFFLQSLLFGLSSGAFYDVFRILRIARKPRAAGWAEHRFLRFGDFILCLLGDMLFWLILAVCYSIFIYRMAYGRLRLMSLLALLCGFAIWFFTLGRLTVFLADRIIMLVRRLVCILLSVTLLPLRCLICFVGKKIAAIFGRIFGTAFDSAKRKREWRLASRGFGVISIKKKKNKGESPSQKRRSKK